MCIASLTLVCLSGLAVQRVFSQESEFGVDFEEDDQAVAASDHHDHHHGHHHDHHGHHHHHHGGKYFQYIHVPSKHHYEHGHKRGNHHHHIERHEKVHPHDGEFKTKVRWGDKHGGYGEHYWDYNHAGHHHDDHEKEGDESQLSVTYVEAPEGFQPQESKTVPAYVSAPRTKRNPDDDVEFINDHAKSRILDARTPKHGGNYRRTKHARPKRELPLA
ncbi:hypothetical protein ABEB36_008785 [Hypothenemus hampei]|uniref:Uncharacterized protein n=1 Tax=Hypothenemus hampei TaxID=57062 RepID=A0ABD1EN21_HYPHA